MLLCLLENGLDIKRIDTAKEHNTSGVLRVYSKTYDKKEANKKEVVKGLVSLINHGAQIFFKRIN